MDKWTNDGDGWWSSPGAYVTRMLSGEWAWGIADGKTGLRPTRFQAQESAVRALKAIRTA